MREAAELGFAGRHLYPQRVRERGSVGATPLERVQSKGENMTLIRRLLRDRRGAAMVEYGLLVAGIALMTAAGTSILGHKAADLVGTMAAVLPGAHGDDNNPIVSGKLIETTDTVPGTDSTGAASEAISRLSSLGHPSSSSQSLDSCHHTGFSRRPLSQI